MTGILLVDKPLNWTSFDVVNYIRKQVALAENKRPKNVKVGHTGTLDPLATGLLVLLIGKEYTKRAIELTKLDKTYEVQMTLGSTSSTGDREGEITVVSNKKPSLVETEKAFSKFIGEIEQIPPIYSAIKVNGQRAYKLARAGQEVKLQPRPVTIHSLVLTDYTYPVVSFTATVSSGTFIRSLVSDIGDLLGIGAYLSGLRRTRIGKFNLDGAISTDKLDANKINHNLILD